MTAKEVEAKLARRYSPPFFVFFPQFRDATGWEAGRTADAVALGLYATRGYAFHGFEIKVNRSDWLAELKNAKKSDAVGVYCDRWWVVAPPGVILPGEVPDAWGWLEATGRGLRGVKEAPERKAHPMERHVICSLIQRALGGKVEGEIVSAEEASKREARKYEQGRKDEREKYAREFRMFQEHERSIKAFEEKTGIDYLNWSGAEMGARVKLLMELGDDRFLSDAERTSSQIRQWADDIEKLLEAARAEAAKARGEQGRKT